MTDLADTLELTVCKSLLRGREPDFIAQVVQRPVNVVEQIAEAYGWPDEAKVRAAVDQLTRPTALPDRTHRGNNGQSRQTVAHPRTTAPALPTAQGSTTAPSAIRTPAPSLPPAVSVTDLSPGPRGNGAVRGTTSDLIGRAAESRSKRTQALGAKLHTLVTDLSSRLDTEEAEIAAAREAEKANAELRAEAGRLQEQLADVMAKLGNKPTRRNATRNATRDATAHAAPPRDYDPKTVRAWAHTAGVDCPAVGRVPNRIIEQWRAAQVAA